MQQTQPMLGGVDDLEQYGFNSYLESSLVHLQQQSLDDYEAGIADAELPVAEASSAGAASPVMSNTRPAVAKPSDPVPVRSTYKPRLLLDALGVPTCFRLLCFLLSP